MIIYIRVCCSLVCQMPSIDQGKQPLPDEKSLTLYCDLDIDTKPTICSKPNQKSSSLSLYKSLLSCHLRLLGFEDWGFKVSGLLSCSTI